MPVVYRGFPHTYDSAMHNGIPIHVVTRDPRTLPATGPLLRAGAPGLSLPPFKGSVPPDGGGPGQGSARVVGAGTVMPVAPRRTR